MDAVIQEHLTNIKKTLSSFGWWGAKAGTTIHTEDVINAVDCIDQWRTEVEAFFATK